MCRYTYIATALSLILLTGAGYAQERGAIKLPAPVMTGGMPLMQALKARHSTREFSGKALSPQVLSNLLWAAAGVNRPDSGKRTAPSARNWREIDIYITLPEGAYRFDANEHVLLPVRSEDLRAQTGVQDFVARAPVNLVYVANLDRMQGASSEHQDLYAAADTGFIAQNVYLFCASEGLATVVRGSVDREALAPMLGLGEWQRIILAQTVGYPAK
ncbi:MAG: nitroreductase [Gammaproteobacteria bacterium SG8_47]|nr:MAG: nitroreductase [Gammaproteobacteria bacterium SG8_47]